MKGIKDVQSVVHTVFSAADLHYDTVDGFEDIKQTIAVLPEFTAKLAKYRERQQISCSTGPRGRRHDDRQGHGQDRPSDAPGRLGMRSGMSCRPGGIRVASGGVAGRFQTPRQTLPGESGHEIEGRAEIRSAGRPQRQNETWPVVVIEHVRSEHECIG